MHFEECSVDEENAEIINRTKEEGGRIISVGTTSTRTLESMAENAPKQGEAQGTSPPGYSSIRDTNSR